VGEFLHAFFTPLVDLGFDGQSSLGKIDLLCRFSETSPVTAQVTDDLFSGYARDGPRPGSHIDKIIQYQEDKINEIP
jgi:hypothetical protein